jgi:hypothetical protein
MSEHKKALEFLKRNINFYFSPMAIRGGVNLTIMESTLGRKLRQDRADGKLKSKREYLDNSRWYVAYAWRKTQKRAK